MSLWTCPEHGLYGGDVFCPTCGGIGSYTTARPMTAEDYAEAGIPVPDDRPVAWPNRPLTRQDIEGTERCEECGDETGECFCAS